MKKQLLIILLSISSLSADYLLTIQTSRDGIISRCIQKYYTTESSIFYKKSIDGYTYYVDFRHIEDYSIKSGYLLDTSDNCLHANSQLNEYELKSDISLNSNNLSFLGLSDSELNFAFAISGIILSSIFLFGIFKYL